MTIENRYSTLCSLESHINSNLHINNDIFSCALAIIMFSHANDIFLIIIIICSDFGSISLLFKNNSKFILNCISSKTLYKK